MKKMSYTKSESKSILSFLGRGAFLILFALCFSITANAQVTGPLEIRSDSSATEHGPITDKVAFTDDNSGDGTLYSDADTKNGTDFPGGRADTLTVCPKNDWDKVRVTFTEFDLADGDTLEVYDGNLDSLRADAALGLGSGSGVGVASAFGGWVDANCDPFRNPSGCLSFVFTTTNDDNKGTGWEAWVESTDRGIAVEAPDDLWENAACGDDGAGAPVAMVDIKAAKITTDCDLADEWIEVVISSSAGDCVTRTVLAEAQLGAIAFPVGHYTITHTLIADRAKSDEQTLTVVAPNLIANDNVVVALGNNCDVSLGLDNLLEGEYCDTNANAVTYTIVVSDADGNEIVTSTTSSVKVEKSMLPDFCGGVLDVTITRTLDYSTTATTLNAVCKPSAIVSTVNTTVTVRDDIKPAFSRGIRTDTIANVNNIDSVRAFLGALESAPTASDNCATPTVGDPELVALASDRCDDVATYTVTWTTSDDCGNSPTPLVDTIRVIRPTVFTQAAPVTKDCQLRDGGIDPILADAKYRPGIEIGIVEGGVITAASKDTITLSEEVYVANYILVRTKVEDAPADCGGKYFVDWGVVDWCDGDLDAIPGTQVINFVDMQAPAIVEGIVSYDYAKANPVYLPHFSCSLDKSPLPTVVADDNCDENPDESMENVQYLRDGVWTDLTDSEGNRLTTLGAAIAAEAIDCDTFRVAYIATDECHEQTEVARDTSYIVVLDNTLPSAVCTDQLNVSLPNEWGARVYVADVDPENSSYDACGIKSKLIRIKDSGDDFGPYVEIGCQYIHTELKIEMQVIDNKDNENYCWVDVNVEDKIAPVCENLAQPRPFYCDEFHNGELGEATDVWANTPADILVKHRAYFGEFNCYDNLDTEECEGLQNPVEQYKLTEWPCGKMEIERRFQIQDWQPNTSVNKDNANDNWAYQTINVEYREDWSFTVPADEEGSCAAIDILEGVTIDNGACDQLGIEHTDKIIRISGDECYKIERTYHIINWCTYTAGDDAEPISRVQTGEHGEAISRTITSDDFAGKGYFTYVQVLKVSDDTAPIVTVVAPNECINGVDFDAEPYGEEDDDPRSAPFECDETKRWIATAIDECNSEFEWVGYLKDANGIEVPGTRTTNAYIDYIVLPGESYTAEFWAYDPCGNSGGGESDPVKFRDCKKPTPYVLNGIVLDLMEDGDNGVVGIWASDLNRNSFDNCTDQDFLEYRIWTDFADTAEPDSDVADATEAGVTALDKVLDFDCERVGTNVVYIYVIDEDNNWDVVQTYVIVQDNMNVCNGNDPQGGMVAGRIVNPNGENVEQVNITVTGGDQKSMTTGTDGQFQFALATDANYTVTPTKDINPLNGVSTFDLVLISKHILGITQFDSPYKYIAADVNKSGSITAFDMVQLRQLILNITTEFSSNDSWRFVDANHNFTTANAASENFNEFYNITALNGEMMNMDFVGVKIGDVNGNAQANSLLGAESRTTNGALTLTTTDRFVEAGETVSVAFTAAEIANAQGYQFTLNFAGQNAEIVEGVAKAANFNTNLADRGVITTSWNGEATANDELFAVSFTATAPGLLSELVSVSSDITTAEAYNTAGELMDVNIDFTTAAVADFALNQNTPNPFKGETVIGFNLPAAGTATLTVMDVQGKVLKSIRADYAKGANQVTLNANELSATGVLYYQLESANNVATKKMIIIE